jgi:alanyl-tRNA synthetase
MDLAEAKKLGAMALFGEKYPDRVRVVSMGDFSIELCGGTHLTNTGQVGLCKIVAEEASGKGVRRIEALTGQKALERVRQTEDLLRQLAVLLKTPQPEDLPRRVAVLQEELREAKQELARQTSQSVAGSIDEFFDSAEEVGGVKIVAQAPQGATREMLRDYIDQLRARKQPVAILLGTVDDGKVALIAAVSRELIERGVLASECIKAAAKVVGGGGGGRPDMAEAGGRFPDKLAEALAEGAKFYREALKK